MDIIKSIEHEQLKNKIPELKVGNTVKVHVRIKEGNKERIQVFEGIIIKVQGGGLNQTFTVRKTSYGVGVEKTFLIHSPLVEKVELVRVGKARRAKLYYLRDRVGKAAKTKELVGARIENREITVKEDLAEEPVAEEAAAPEEAPAVETTAVETQEIVDTVKEEPVVPVTEELPEIELPKITETSEDEISKLINSNEEPEVITDAPISDLPIEEPKPEEPKLEQTQTLDDLRNRLNNIRHK